MAVVVSCPNCRGRGSVPETTIGKKIKCKRCGQVFMAITEADTDKLRSPQGGAPPPPETAEPGEGEYHDDMPI
jgi:predicted Zn finger-like uncharacterized protein